MNIKTLNTAAPFEVVGCRVEPSTLRVTRAGEQTRLESKAMQVLVYRVLPADVRDPLIPN